MRDIGYARRHTSVQPPPDLVPAPAGRQTAQAAVLEFVFMASRLLALLIAAFLATSPAHAAGSGRVALIIGNASYSTMPLANPVNDARLMAETLRAVGFEVIARENASKRDMELAILSFGEKLKNAGAGVFYYAGHGLQVRGRNYLIPVEATIETESAVRVEGVDVDLVLAEMGDARAAANIVILDACRNNPFERKMRGGSRGLAAIDAAAGTLIAYATAPGSTASDGTGKNGLYTEELAKALKQPNLKAEEVFKRVRIGVMQRSQGAQTPWESSSLTGELVFNQAAAPPPAPAVASAQPAAPTGAPAAPRTGGGDDQAELAFWDAIKGSGSPAEFRAYLESFPNGRFAPLARLRAQQGAPPSASQAAVPAVAAAPATAPVRPDAPGRCRARFVEYSPPPAALTCTCPEGENARVWGTDIYTNDSSVCAAARHAGVIPAGGGPVTIYAAPGQQSYDGARRNGVASSAYGSWGGSFTFHAPGAARSPGPPLDCPDSGQALRDRAEPMTCMCSAAAVAVNASVWGSDVYTDDSGVCPAARHAGIIGTEGGLIRVRWTGGRPSYGAANRNGIASRGYGSWSGSLVFEAGK